MDRVGEGGPDGPRSRRSAGPNLRIPSPPGPPMTVYIAEEFTPDEADVLRRYFTNLDGPGLRPGEPARGGEGRPVRPLLPQLQEPAAPVPRRVRRRPRHHRRRHHRRHRGAAPGRGALRPGVLRVRRRLRRPARRRAPGLRAGVEPAHQGARVGPADGLPRAVHPLHRLRHPPRRPLPLLPRSRRCSAPSSGSATSATWTGCSTPTPSWCR